MSEECCSLLLNESCSDNEQRVICDDCDDIVSGVNGKNESDHNNCNGGDLMMIINMRKKNMMMIITLLMMVLIFLADIDVAGCSVLFLCWFHYNHSNHSAFVPFHVKQQALISQESKCFTLHRNTGDTLYIDTVNGHVYAHPYVNTNVFFFKQEKITTK